VFFVSWILWAIAFSANLIGDSGNNSSQLTLEQADAVRSQNGHVVTEKIQIRSAWIRATAPGQTNAAAYMQITNIGDKSDELISVKSPASERVELHKIITESGSSKMIPWGVFKIASGEAVSFTPSTQHVMFIKITQNLTEGAMVPVTFLFKNAGEVKSEFEIKPIGYRGAGDHMSSTHHH